MDPITFRRDPYLRTSAYHLATWSLVATVLELRLATGAAAAGSRAVLPVLLAGAVLTSLTHERRVGKMTGPAGAPLVEGAARIWVQGLSVLAAVSAVLVVAERPQLVFDAWMLGVGVGFVVWGRAAAFAWYVGLGLAMIATAVVDFMLLSAAGVPLLQLRLLASGVVIPGLALLTNRRFLWFRPERDG